MNNKTKLLSILLNVLNEYGKSNVGFENYPTLFAYENSKSIGFSETILARIEQDGGVALRSWAIENFNDLFDDQGLAK